MKGNDPEFLEAVRLAQRFFPECESLLWPHIGMHWEVFLGAMQLADYAVDHSCDPARPAGVRDLGLAAKGGMAGTDSDIYVRLLEHAGFSPRGRAVVVPKALGYSGWSEENCLPFVCKASTVTQRMSDTSIFGHNRDTLLVFESGEAMLIDHDERFHWARSRRRAFSD